MFANIAKKLPHAKFIKFILWDIREGIWNRLFFTFYLHSENIPYLCPYIGVEIHRRKTMNFSCFGEFGCVELPLFMRL